MQIMIKAEDIYYLPRIENLRKEYIKLQNKHKELQEDFDQKVEFETGSCHLLNVIIDKMKTAEDLMVALESQIERLRLEISN